MKKLLFGISLLLSGMAGIIALTASTIVCPLIPWSYNNIEGWLAVIMGMGLLVPFVSFILVAVVGLLICIREAYFVK